jgi:hypothetical protein
MLKYIALLIVGLALAGCGGGSSGEITSSSNESVGLWRGQVFDTFNAPRDAFVLTLEDWSAWLVFFNRKQPQKVDGTMFARDNGSPFGWLYSLHWYFEQNRFFMSGSFYEVTTVPRDSVDIRMIEAHPGVSCCFSGFKGDYDAAGMVRPTLAQIAGTYSGQADMDTIVASSMATATATVALSLASTGEFITSLPGGCDVSGKLTPRTDVGAYDASFNFDAECPAGPETRSGLAFLDPVSGWLYLMSLQGPPVSSFRGFVFYGTP